MSIEIKNIPNLIYKIVILYSHIRIINNMFFAVS